MSGDAGLAIQQTIFSALSSNPPLLALGVQVFDSVPALTPFPYVQIGDDTSVDFCTQSFDGQNSTLTIHSWTQNNAGRKDVKTIMKAIYDCLHKARLTISGQVLLDIRCEFATSSLDPDGITYHGVQRFRALTQGV